MITTSEWHYTDSVLQPRCILKRSTNLTFHCLMSKIKQYWDEKIVCARYAVKIEFHDLICPSHGTWWRRGTEQSGTSWAWLWGLNIPGRGSTVPSASWDCEGRIRLLLYMANVWYISRNDKQPISLYKHAEHRKSILKQYTVVSFC